MGQMREFMEKQKAKKADQPEQDKALPSQVVKPKSTPPKGGSSTAPPKAKEQPKPKGPAQPPQAKKKKKPWFRPSCPICYELTNKHRLPVGSKFTNEYVAENVWKGTLTVPGLPSFSAEAQGLAKLNQTLDRQWQEIAYEAGKRPYEIADKIKKNKQQRWDEKQKQLQQTQPHPIPALIEQTNNEPLDEK
jgi:hypothetical protein